MRTSTTWRTLSLTVICLLVLTSVVGCSSMAGKMAGKWQVEGSDVTIQFNSGQSLTSTEGPGTYRSIDSTHVRLALPDAGVAGMTSGDYTISFPTSDTMTLVDAAGTTYQLTKVK